MSEEGEVEVQQMSVDPDAAVDTSSLESQSTPTFSRKLNANAVEFVPGKYISGSAPTESKHSMPAAVSTSVPNPAAPVFVPQFHISANGYMAQMPVSYGMPYYMYVPAGAGMKNADGSVVVSPVLTYQATSSTAAAPAAGGSYPPQPYVRKSGSSKPAPLNGGVPSSRPPRQLNKTGGKYGKSVDQPASEPSPQISEPVVKPEDFPSVLGVDAAAAPVGNSSEVEAVESAPVRSWASIAKKATAVVKKEAEMKNLVVEQTESVVDSPVAAVVTDQQETSQQPPAEDPVPSAELPKSVDGLHKTSSVDGFSPDFGPKAPSVRSEPPNEPRPQMIPVSAWAVRAQWCATTEQPLLEIALPLVTESLDTQQDIVSPKSVVSTKCIYSVEFLKRLRFHELSKLPLVASGVLVSVPLPSLLVRPTNGEDWRAEAAAEKLVRSSSRRKGSRRGAAGIEISPEMLIPSENSWSVAHQKKADGLDENVKVGRRIFAVLNKLTIEKFNKLADQLFMECGICKPAHIITLVKYLFEKATVQHHFIPMYADLCSRCLSWLSSGDSVPPELIESIAEGQSGDQQNRMNAAADIFRRVLLERCQEAFYSYFLTNEDTEDAVPKATTETAAVPEEGSTEQEEARQKHRLGMLGTVKFVAQLLERRLMTRAVFKNCLETLLYSDDRTEDHVECACVFLSEIGCLFDTTVVAPATNPNGLAPTVSSSADQYSRALNEAMDTLSEIAANESTSARIKFTVLNLVDLRANGYQQEGLKSAPSTSAPAKISEIHKQAAKEESGLIRSISRSHNASSSQLAAPAATVADDWETVPLKKKVVSQVRLNSSAIEEPPKSQTGKINAVRMRLAADDSSSLGDDMSPQSGYSRQSD